MKKLSTLCLLAFIAITASLNAQTELVFFYPKNTATQQYPFNGNAVTGITASQNYFGLIAKNDNRQVWTNPNTATTLDPNTAPYFSVTLNVGSGKTVQLDRFVLGGYAVPSIFLNKTQLRWSVDNYASSLGEFKSAASGYALTSVDLSGESPIAASSSITFRVYLYAGYYGGTSPGLQPYIYFGQAQPGVNSNPDGTPTSYAVYSHAISIFGSVTNSCAATTSTTNATVCASALPYNWNGLTFNAAGTQTVHLTNAAGCDSAATLNLTVTANASAGQILSNTNGIVNNLSICSLGTQVSLYPQVTGGNWTSKNTAIAVGARQTSTTSSGYIKGIAAGTTTIAYTLPTLINGCNPVSLITVTVAPQSTPSAIVGNAIACLNTPTTYTSTPAGGVWSGARGTFADNVFTPTSVGPITVIYKVTNAAGCSASITKAVTIAAKPATPSINFAAGTTGITGTGGYCTNRTFTLVGVPAGGTWSKTGAIASITSGGVVTTTSVTGAASAIYTVTANGCSSSRSTIGNIVACSPRGVSSSQPTVDGGQFIVYPNPAHNVISLKVDKLMGAGSIVVTDLYGKQIKQQPLSMGSNTIDVSSFAKGMYMVTIITEQGKQTQKVVVE